VHEVLRARHSRAMQRDDDCVPDRMGVRSRADAGAEPPLVVEHFGQPFMAHDLRTLARPTMDRVVTDAGSGTGATSAAREIVRRRLVAQRIATSAFTRPAEIVGWLGAVQAQDYLGALWAVGLRPRERRRARARRANDRSIVADARDAPFPCRR